MTVSLPPAVLPVRLSWGRFAIVWAEAGVASLFCQQLFPYVFHPDGHVIVLPGEQVVLLGGHVPA
jgi:hypothetical protein